MTAQFLASALLEVLKEARASNDVSSYLRLNFDVKSSNTFAQYVPIEARLSKEHPFIPLMVRTKPEVMCGEIHNLTHNTYQINMQNYRNSRRYFDDRGARTEIPFDERDISVTVELYKLLSDCIESLVMDAEKDKKMVVRTDKARTAKSLIVPCLTYHTAVQTITKGGDDISNAILRLKLVPTKKDPSIFMIKTFLDRSHDIHTGKPLTTENISVLCPRRTKVTAIVNSSALTLTATGIYLRMYIDDLKLERPADTSSSPLDDEDEEGPRDAPPSQDQE